MFKTNTKLLLLASTLSVAGSLNAAGGFLPDANGIISLEAESASGRTGSAGEAFSPVSRSGASAGAMAAPETNWYTVNTAADANAPSLEWPITINDGGEYKLWVRGYSFDSGSDSIWQQIDSALPASVHGFSANSWSWRSALSVTLQEGSQTLKLLQREKRLVVDKVVLQPATLAAPTGTGPIESGSADTDSPFVASNGMVTVEAENAMAAAGNSGDEWLPTTSPAGAAGALAMKAPADAWYTTRAAAANAPSISMPLRLNQTGSYHVWIRGYAFDGGSDSVWWNLDNAQLRQRHSFAANRWTWRRAGVLQLDEGDHTLNLVQREKNIVVDKIVVQLAGNSRPTGTGPAESDRAGNETPNLPPIARAGNSLTAVVGDTVELNGGDSTDADGTIASYTWYNGSVEIGSGQQIQYTVESVGIQTVSLTVTDDDGATDTATLDIDVTPPPTSPFIASNGIVSVEAESAVAAAGNSGDEWLPTTSPGGASNALAMKAPADAWYTNRTAAATAPTISMPLRLNQTGSYHVWIRAYAFDGGSDSVWWNLDNAQLKQRHSFATNRWTWRRAGVLQLDEGDHTLNLVQREKNIVVDKIVVQLAGNSTPTGTGPAESDRAGNETPNLPPVARAGNNLTAVVGDTVELNGGSSTDADGTIASYTWRNGSVEIGSGRQIQYTVASVGIQTVSLTVTDNDGASDTDTVSISVSGILDSDGDGVPDNSDNCPFVAGPANNNGCPITSASCLPDFQSAGFNKNLWPQTDFGLPTTVGQSKTWTNPNGGNYSVLVTKVADTSSAASVGGSSYLHTRPEYSQHDAFSADGTYLISHGITDRVLYNSSTYQPVRLVRYGSAKLRDWQWHPTTDHLAFYFDTNDDRVYRYDAIQNSHTVLFDFAANPVNVEGRLFSDLGTSDGQNAMGAQGSISADGNSVSVILNSGGHGAVLQLNLDTATVGGSLFFTGKDNSSELDNASISPDGRYIIVLGEFNSLYGTSFSRKQLYSYDLQDDLTIQNGTLVLGREGHFDVGLNKNGDPVVAYFLYLPFNGWTGITNDNDLNLLATMGYYNLHSGTYHQLHTKASGIWGTAWPGGHISMPLDGNGVALVSTYQGGSQDSVTSVQDSAMLAVDLETGNVAWMGWDEAENDGISDTLPGGAGAYWGQTNASLVTDVVTSNGSRGWKWAWVSDNGDASRLPDYYVGELVCN